VKVQSSIDGIKISLRERRGDPHVQFVGGLAAILELAVSGKQKTAIQKMAVLASFWWLRGRATAVTRT